MSLDILFREKFEFVIITQLAIYESNVFQIFSKQLNSGEIKHSGSYILLLENNLNKCLQAIAVLYVDNLIKNHGGMKF